MDPLPHMTESISVHAIRIWRTTSAITELVTVTVLAALLLTSYHFHWYDWLTTVLWILLLIVPIDIIWSIFIEPKWKYSYWKYGVNEYFIRFTRGRLFKTQTVIPMANIQYVAVEQGPLLRLNHVHTITIGTLGGSHKIPMLPEEEAFALRKQIANYAQIKEVDV